MLEKIINIDECEKKVLIDSTITGFSNENSNFDTILQEYDLKGNKIYGTKGVIVNIESFLDNVLKNYCSDNQLDLKKEKINIKENYSDTLKQCLDNNYAKVFWDKTSEVHHRDMMNLIYSEFKDSIDSYINKLNNSDIKDEKEMNYVINKIDNLENLSNDLETSLSELKYTKLPGKVELSDLSKKMIRYSQGYQLSSVKKEEKDNLWQSKITRLQLDSGITKDQESYQLSLSYDESKENIKAFLNSLVDVEIKTNVIEIPERIIKDVAYRQENELIIDSVSLTPNNESYFKKKKSKLLRYLIK